MATIGVLALQGDYAEHVTALRKLDTEIREVRLSAQLEGLDGLIIPGGESTTQARLMDVYDLRKPLRKCIRDGMAVWGTCAGLIMLAKTLTEGHPEPLGLMDMEVQRNAYGRQVDSFETDLSIPALCDPTFHAVFIRAPKIQRVGKSVDILASLQDGEIVAAQEKRMMVTAFHPELTQDARFHQYFMKIATAR